METKYYQFKTRAEAALFDNYCSGGFILHKQTTPYTVMIYINESRSVERLADMYYKEIIN